LSLQISILRKISILSKVIRRLEKIFIDTAHYPALKLIVNVGKSCISMCISHALGNSPYYSSRTYDDREVELIAPLLVAKLYDHTHRNSGMATVRPDCSHSGD
jgi:hypothetical protein